MVDLDSGSGFQRDLNEKYGPGFAFPPRSVMLSLQSWTGELSESFVVKRHADIAFKSKDFATVVECYSRACGRGYLQAQHFHLQYTVYCYSLQILACRVCHHEVILTPLLNLMCIVP
ncbi:hypothetical protein PVAP13_6NG110009 [Panicum virgatum]|uniref:Serine/threonine-protein kinase BSK1-like TPR repeats domain-containing protein n=1 Tax=Panicum virgatum TaxID=38727 RepID=A0A8T0QXI4_PANVG|nr:hypothetical protein PVAP13_6NG110009 [Panicum virgatum]